ncbi:MAG: hypothetical protein AAFR88_07735 [Pseudomonadota bacterium]
MIYSTHPPTDLTPVEVGLELLLGSQELEHDVIAFGIAIFMSAVMGALGVGFVKLMAGGIAHIRADLGGTFVRARRGHRVRALDCPNPKPHKGNHDGI